MGRSADRPAKGRDIERTTGSIRLSTRSFGDLEVPLDRVLTLPDGLLGFPDRFRFARIALGEGPFESLVSLDDPELLLSVGDPTRLVPEYAPPLEEAAAALHAAPGDVSFLAFLTIPDDVRETTIDLSAPLAIDGSRHVARQLVVADPNIDAQVKVFRNPR